MADSDFSTHKSAQEWFVEQSIETHCLITSRAALRVFANFRTHFGGALDDMDLALLRASLISAGRGVGKPTDIDWNSAVTLAAANSASSAAHSAAASADQSASLSPKSAGLSSAAANCAGCAAGSAANEIRSAAHGVANFSYSLYGSGFSDLNAATLWDSQNLDRLSKAKLWAGAKTPEDIVQNHETVLTAMRANPAFDFWVRFYRGMWEGTFDEWDLAFEVIQIEEEHWEKGYVHIGEVIAKIEARLRLEQEIENLKAQLEQLRTDANVPSVGHNQGPALEDVELQIAEELKSSGPILEKLEQEIAKDDPDPELIQKLAIALWDIAKAVATYCGGKIDKALDKAAETIGETGTKWAIRIGAGSLVTANDGVQSVAKAAWEFAKTLLG